MRFRIDLRVIVLAAAGLAACHDSPTGTHPGSSLRFSGAAGVSDTIEAIIPQALLVEVRDTTGALAPAGTVVRFTAVPTPGRFGASEAIVEALTSTFFSDFASGLTDAAGKAGVLVRLGTKAGTARLVVTVPTLGLEDTARFTVTPGNAVQVLVSPADTAIYVGKSFTLRGGVADRVGNARTDPVTWSSTGAGVTVTSAGVVTATALGRYQLRADGIAGGVAGTATGSVSVVPAGRMAAVGWADNFQSRTIIALDVDGSNKATLTSGVRDGGIGIHPAWIPGTTTVIYTSVSGDYQKLYTVAAGGAAKLFFATTPPTVTHEAEPTPSADGKWLFYSVYDTQCSVQDYCIARVKIDGSGYELLLTVPSRQPAPSPDGSKVAYVTPNATVIRVLDVATKTSSTWSVGGTTPTWSPDGTRIAYRTWSGAVAILFPDGTTQSIPGAPYVVALSSWSPDGKWLIVQSQYNQPALLDPATGTLLPLGYAAAANISPASMK